MSSLPSYIRVVTVQAFPYFYVPYEEDFPAEASSGDDTTAHPDVHAEGSVIRVSTRPHAVTVLRRVWWWSWPGAALGFLRRMAQALERAMQAGLDAAAPRHQRVFAMHLVRACPFYGYHPDERLFIKIMMWVGGHSGSTHLMSPGKGVSNVVHIS